MIAFAFLDLDGIPTGGGIKPSLPDGAVALVAPFSTIDLPRLMFVDGAWVERPSLPSALPTTAGFHVEGLPNDAWTVVTDLGTGAQLESASGDLPEDGTFEVAVTAPRPWLSSSVILTRGKGSPEINASRLASARSLAIARVNASAGKLRLKVYTDIPGQDALYLEKRAEAKAYLALSAEPAGLEDFPLIANEIGPGLTARTAYELAQVWLNRSHLFKQIGGATEKARLRAAYAIAEAGDEAAIARIEEVFHEALARLPI